LDNLGVWLLVGVGLLAIASGLFGFGERPPEVAPGFSLLSLDGEVVSLFDYRGQVVLLDFWASWCKPCRTTFPAVHSLAEAYAGQGLKLLVISLDASEEDSRELLLEEGFPTDNVLWGSLDEARAVKALYGVGGIPRTFLIDRQGLIRFDGYPRNLTAETIEPWL
jgi:thiol-disulfide isomerase/thioredoxin